MALVDDAVLDGETQSLVAVRVEEVEGRALVEDDEAVVVFAPDDHDLISARHGACTETIDNSVVNFIKGASSF